MTSPIPVTGKTPIYEIEYVREGEPAFHLRAKQERQALRLETLLQQRALAPPAAQDLAAVSGRVTTLEGRATALEGTVAAAVPYVKADGTASGWSDFGAPWRGLRYWRQGRTVFVSGVMKNSVAIAAGTNQVAGRIPAGFRPGATEMIPAMANASAPLRADFAADGLVTIANNGATTVNASAFILVNGHWSLD